MKPIDVQIESFSVDTAERRLARVLIRFSERLGAPKDDGSVGMMPFTHQALARYVGASRELVTQFMNRFRKQGFVSHSRRGIIVHLNSLKTVLPGLESSFASS
jgi:CRP-like cAMP-binding protein